MAHQFFFNPYILDNLPAPAVGFDVVQDISEPRLRLYITSRGAKTFFVRKRVRGRDRRIIIGSYPEIDIETARGMVANVLDDATKKIPVRRKKVSFRDFWELYLKNKVRRTEDSQVKLVRAVNLHLNDLFNKNLDDIMRADVEKIINECVTFIRTLRKKYDWIAVPDREKMEKKINADIQLAKNKEFKKRYMTGYASINITTNSSDQLERIANDFIESCAIKNSRQNPRNKMACIFKEHFVGWSSNKIHEELLKYWDAYKDELINYYKTK